MSDQPIPVTLILLARSGDHQAMNTLLARVQAGLYGYIVRLVEDRHLAEDILQDVFMLIWRKLYWLRDPEFFRPWAYRIASRAAFQRLRRHRFLARMLGRDTELAEAVSAPVQPLPPALETTMPELLAAVSPASRAVLILHYLQGMSLNETALVLDISPGTAKSRLAYGLATLRQKVGPDGTFLPAARPANDIRSNQKGKTDEHSND
jgi:RNA polymerase sigma-70 factor (ECF subfamily)